MSKLKDAIATFAARWLYKHQYSVLINVSIKGEVQMAEWHSYYYGVAMDRSPILRDGTRFNIPRGQFSEVLPRANEGGEQDD